MNEIQEITANRIQSLLKKHKMSQVELAQKSELSKGTISKAAARGELSKESAKRIASALGVSLDFLYGNSDVESIEEYALTLVEQHISSFASKMSGVYNGMVAGISLSPALASYLEQSAEIKKAPLPERVRTDGLYELKQSFLQQMEMDLGEKKCYVLIDARLYTADVERAIAKAESEITIAK